MCLQLQGNTLNNSDLHFWRPSELYGLHALILSDHGIHDMPAVSVQMFIMCITGKHNDMH